MNAFDPTSVLSQSEPSPLTVNLERPPHIPAKPLTEAALCDWIASSVPGERIQYHQGLLLLDRSETSSSYPSRERQRIHAVAKRAWNACELGLVHLVSQRIGPFVFGYFAVRARMTPRRSAGSQATAQHGPLTPSSPRSPSKWPFRFPNSRAPARRSRPAS